MAYPVTKKTLTAQPVLAVRRTITPDGIAKALSEMFPQVAVFLQQNGIAMAGAPYARYLSMKGNEWVIEAGFPVAASVAGSGEVTAETLPGGPAAFTLHAGHYNKLRDAHSAVHDWIVEQKLDPAGAPWESYITDPGQHPDPKDWKTEVYVPLKS